MNKAGEGREVKRGFTAGSFDLCHAGHIRMFRDCKSVCDYLVVAVQEDPSIDRPEKNKPVMSLAERLEIVSALKYVDEVITYRTEKDLFELLSLIPFDVRILGSDWEGKPFTGHELPHTFYFHRRNHTFSSSELRKRIYEAEKNSI
ncbi:MAG: adenylyltransferase/cytidyltransferase family protein [Patescibacteria group bacterium]